MNHVDGIEHDDRFTATTILQPHEWQDFDR